MSRHRYPIGSRVRFSCLHFAKGEPGTSRVFVGTITGYCAKHEYAFIRDDGFAKSRPVAVSRILAYAVGDDVPRVVA